MRQVTMPQSFQRPASSAPWNEKAEELFRREPLTKSNSFVRLAAARALEAFSKKSFASIVTRHWPNDRVLDYVARAPSAPAMTSVAGWAAELAQTVVYDALEALGPASSAAELFRHGLVLSFDGAGAISCPGFVAEFGNAGFVAEGLPIPVQQRTLGIATLNPHKLCGIAVLTEEMMESSNLEALIGDVAVKAAGRMLDEVLYDANPGDASRPRGLRYGVANLTPSNATDLLEACLEDVTALINAVAPVGGNGPYALIASPGRAMVLRSKLVGHDEKQLLILGSSAVINDVLCVAPAALVAALSPDPEIESTSAGTVVMDTAPGAAGTMAEKGLFQTRSVAIKMRWPVTWALRDPRGFAWLTPVWKS
jgi:hypothetical protein